MKKNWKYFTFMATIAIIALVYAFTACDSGGGGNNNSNSGNNNSNPGNSGNPIIGAATLIISNEQVYYSDYITEFNGDMAITDNGIGGSGSITSGNSRILLEHRTIL